MPKVLIYDKYWTVKDVKENPTHLFVFGDNDIGIGKGGQAIIRFEENAMGIPTKKKPSHSQDAYYTDDELKENKQKINNAIRKIADVVTEKQYEVVVFSKDGLGTGLAKLASKAPKTFEHLNKSVDKLKTWIEDN